MYTLSCLQVAYEFLNREWMFLIYGREQKKTWYQSLKNWINRWYLNILNPTNFKIDYQFLFTKNYQFPIIVIIMSLGAFFTAYKVMKKLQTLEVNKYVMEFQWWRNENSNEMSPAFHENNNESPQLTEDFTVGTSLTAIVKPTTRTSETWETIKVKDDEGHTENDNISLTPSQSFLSFSAAEKSKCDSYTKIRGNMFRSMKEIFEKNAQNVDNINPLVKCSSSLYVITSKDSLNAELRTEFITTKNSESLLNENQNEMKEMSINKKTNSSITFAIHDSSSIFEVDDVISGVFEDTCLSVPSPDTPALHKNSSCVSGHFVDRLPDLDLSPIPNLPPKNSNHEQLLKALRNEKEVEEAESKNTEESRDQKRFSRSLSCSPRRLEKSFERFLTCIDNKTDSLDEKTLSEKHRRIPKMNFSVLGISGSKIPIPLTNFQMTGSSEMVLNDISRRSDFIRTYHKSDICFGSKESEQSLEKFLQ